jgi:sec-independent protein translocase protein TatC
MSKGYQYAMSDQLKTKTKRGPFMEHLQELRRRLYYVAISMIFWGIAIYAVQQQVVNALLRPSHGQHFIYTSPGGGIDFLFRIAIYGGFVLSLPVIIYNILRFIEPLISDVSRRFIFIGSFVSGLLAVAGMTFGYYIGLPSALHFLLHQFQTVQIQPLVTIQAYLGFVIVYMVGAALLFQLPLILLFINRIKPLKPRRLLHYERWVILAAFVISGLMNPTPNILSQLLVAGPFILMYQVGILLIAFINRPKKLANIQEIVEQEDGRQAQEAAQLVPATALPAAQRAAQAARPRLILDIMPRR